MGEELAGEKTELYAKMNQGYLRGLIEDEQVIPTERAAPWIFQLYQEVEEERRPEGGSGPGM